MSNRSGYIPLGGGIDLQTPPRQLEPGNCLYAINYECPISGGYRRIDGYTQVGDDVPGEGPMLGVVTFADNHYAVRKDVGADTATLYRHNSSTNAWDTVGAVHNGRHEFVEANVTATEKGRALYGVGGGKPFQLLADIGAVDYQNLFNLTFALRGILPDGVGYAAVNETFILSDFLSRGLTGIEVFDKSDTSIKAFNDVAAATEGPTIAELDFSDVAVNSIGYVRFTAGTEPQTTLTIPELTDPFMTLDNAMSGAKYLTVFTNHLILGFEAGVIQHSGLGKPNHWSASLDGAGEIGVGQAITGLLQGRGGTLHIMCRDSIKTLYGTGATDWQLKTTIPNSGAKPYSVQNLLQPFFVAERGITSLEATDAYGDYRPLQPGAKIEPLFLESNLSDRVTASCVSKTLAQYRVFFDNGTGIYLSPTGATLVRYPDQVSTASNGELDNGEEVLLIGDDSGKVHRVGNGAISFNGAPIEAFITLAYTDLKQPTSRKRFRRAWWDIRSGTDAEISIQPDFDFGRIESARHLRLLIDFVLGGGLWNVDDWGDFTWSVPVLAQRPIDIAGSGTAINFAIYSNTVSEPHEVLGYDLVYSERRFRRG